MPEGSSLHQKGVFLGTPGGAETAFTPTVSARTPCLCRIGMAARVSPGTSRCMGPEAQAANACSLNTSGAGAVESQFFPSL